MTVYNWLCLFGVPTAVALIGKFVWAYVKRRHDDTNALKLGIQAMLRNQMIEYYGKWQHSEGVPIYVRDAYENCWVQYEALGANGVMTDMHEKFMALPIGDYDA